MAPSSSGLLELLRLPWGRRLFHFGILGLVDEDPTGSGWFSVAPQVPPEPASTASSPIPRCARMVVSTVDGESRLREAYRLLLAATHAAEEKQHEALGPVRARLG